MKETFGSKLTQYIDKQGWTLEELVEEVGVSLATIQRWKELDHNLGQSPKNDIKLYDLQRLLGVLSAGTMQSDEAVDFLDLPLIHVNPRLKHEKRVKWIEDLTAISSKAKLEKVRYGINVFEQFFLHGKHVTEMPSLTWAYQTYMDAIHSGALRIVGVERNESLEQQIRDYVQQGAFPGLKSLKNIVVANVDRIDGTPIHAEFVAVLAAKAIFGDLLDVEERVQTDVIAVGRSYTIWRIAQMSVFGNAQTKTFIPLVAFSDDGKYPYSANQIALEFMRLHQGTEAETLPYFEKGNENEKVKYIQQIIGKLNLGIQAILTLDGIGERYWEQPVEDMLSRLLEDNYITPTPVTEIYRLLSEGEKRLQLGGEICGFFLNYDAKLLDIEIQEKSRQTFSPVYEWDEFREKVLRQIMLRGRVWIVTSGAHKIQPTYMAMKHGLGNAFVMDNTVANGIITKLKEGKVSKT